jgi:hypothetical protein
MNSFIITQRFYRGYHYREGGGGGVERKEGENRGEISRRIIAITPRIKKMG